MLGRGKCCIQSGFRKENHAMENQPNLLNLIDVDTGLCLRPAGV